MMSRLYCKNGKDLFDGGSDCTFFTGEDYGQAFNELKRVGVDKLVLDLRGNPGGALVFSDELLRAFSQEGLPVAPATVRRLAGRTRAGLKSASPSSTKRQCLFWHPRR